MHRAGLTVVPNVPWHRAPRRKGAPAPPRKIFFRLFNCHLCRQPNYGYIRNMLRYIHGLLGILLYACDMRHYKLHIYELLSQQSSVEL